MKIYVPPNGFVGAGQQTQAAQLVGTGVPRSRGPAKRRRTAAKKAAAPRRRRRAAAKRSSKRPARLVKGSAAAKRYMASIRRKRRG